MTWWKPWTWNIAPEPKGPEPFKAAGLVEGVYIGKIAATKTIYSGRSGVALVEATVDIENSLLGFDGHFKLTINPFTYARLLVGLAISSTDDHSVLIGRNISFEVKWHEHNPFGIHPHAILKGPLLP